MGDGQQETVLLESNSSSEYGGAVKVVQMDEPAAAAINPCPQQEQQTPNGAASSTHNLEDPITSSTTHHHHNLVDWRGRPLPLLPSSTHLGGSRPSLFILGVVVCAYFAFGGVFFNLVIYLRRVWNQGSATAANNSTNLVGTVYCTCIFGAFLGDTYLGRILAVSLFLAIFTMGCSLSAIGVTMKSKNLDATFIEALLMGALYITALGCGSYQPVIVALGGDQFSDQPTQKSRFFNWVFMASNIGVMLSLTILTYIENMDRWTLGFWISASCAGMSLLIYGIGVPYMQQAKPGGNPLASIVKVVFSAICKLHMKVDNDSSYLYVCDENESPTKLHKIKNNNNKLRWIDKAAITDEKDVRKDGKKNSWRICTIQQVNEVKSIFRIVPFIAVGVLYNVANAQLVSLFVVQGDTMENKVLGFNMPPGSMRLFTNLAGIIFPPFYEYVISPRISRKDSEVKGLTSLQRMGCGLLLGAIAMAFAALVEGERLNVSFKLSIFWLIPQFFVMGISNSFFIVSQMDFFYSEIPHRMRSLGSSLFLLCMGLGNYGSSLVVTIVTYFSSHHHSNWIPHHIDEGHLDYFYWLLFGLLLLTIFLFLIFWGSHRRPIVDTPSTFSAKKSYVSDKDTCNP